MLLRTFAVILLALAPLAAQQPQSKPDNFAAVRAFVGKWLGTSAGEPGNGTVERTYEFVLNDRFIHVKNGSTYPPQEKNKSGEKHEDVGYISFDKGRKKLVLRQFHTEGFVNTYVQQESSDPKRLVFVTEAIENIPPGWRARETYTILNDNELIERFELAEPGKDFALYSESRLRRVR